MGERERKKHPTSVRRFCLMSIPVCINRCRSLFSFSRHLLVFMLIALCGTKNMKNKMRDEKSSHFSSPFLLKRFNIWIDGGDVSLRLRLLDLV
jgi:hypothetical protein